MSDTRADRRQALVEQVLRARGIRRTAGRIAPRRPDEPIPLAPAQRAFWFLERLEPGLPTYNHSIAFRLRGRLSVQALRRALSELRARHEALRTVFVERASGPEQVVQAAGLFELRRVTLPPDSGDGALHGVLADEARRPFDLATGPLGRALLVRLGAEDAVLSVTFHHIVVDGWSASVFARELGELYRAARARVPTTLPPLPVQYADYAVWAARRERPAAAREIARELTGLPLSVGLPFLSGTRTGQGARDDVAVAAETASAVAALAAEAGTTAFAAYLTALQVLLQRCSGQRGIVVATPVANRPALETEGLIGCFANTVLLGAPIDPVASFRDLLRRNDARIRRAFARQHVPIDAAIDAVDPERDGDGQPPFNVMFAFQNAPRSSLELDGLDVEPLRVGERTARFDLMLSLHPDGPAASGFLEYETGRISGDAAALVVRRYGTLLREAVGRPDDPVGRLRLLDAAERQTLEAWGRPAWRPRSPRRDALAARVAWLGSVLPLRADDVVWWNGRLDLDSGPPLVAGWAHEAGAALAAPDSSADGAMVAATVAHLLPDEAEAWLETPPRRLRAIVLAGGVPDAELVGALVRRTGVPVLTLCQSTLTGVEAGWERWARPDPTAEPAIGRPAAHAVRVVDANGEPTPIGVPGRVEVRVGGRWVATEFEARWSAGRLLAAGDVPARVCGRHVDLRLVERQLRRDPRVLDVRALARSSSSGHDEVVAYYVARAPCPPADLRATLADLPAPALVEVTRLPLDARGRVDDAALRRLPVVDEALMTQIGADVASRGARLEVVEARPALVRIGVGGPAPVGRADGVASELSAAGRAGVPAQASGGRRRPVHDAPATLSDALLRQAAAGTERGVLLVDGEGDRRRSYPELAAGALVAVGHLRDAGLRAGDRLILYLTDRDAQLLVLWAAVLGGMRPLVVAAPPSAAGEAPAKLVSAWERLGRPRIVTGRAQLAALEQAFGGSPLLADDLTAPGPEVSPAPARPADVAFLQLTSGSTGASKAVQLSHRSILEHVHASAAFNGYRPDDVALNWIPLDHVVPVVTYHFRDVVLGCDELQVEAAEILAEPTRWLDLIDRHRVTDTWSPNFGFKLVVDAVRAQPERRWDLSSVVRVMNAGEQVTARVVRAFLECLSPFGLREGAIQPAFGMAELATCVSYHNAFRLRSSSYRVRKDALPALRDAGPDDGDVVLFVDLGDLIPGVECRIVDDDGRVVDEAVIGRVQFRGRVVTVGYLDDAEANEAAFAGGGWFDSGDLGFLVQGRLAIAGRAKEVMVIRGANYFCHEVEELAAAVDGVSPTLVAACSVPDEDSGTEDLAVFFVPEPGASDVDAVGAAVSAAVGRALGIAPRYLVPLTEAEFPRTTSGKIQRGALRAGVVGGRFAGRGRGATAPDWFSEPTWVPRELVEDAPPDSGARIVVTPDEALAAALSDADGERWSRVEPGVHDLRRMLEEVAVSAVVVADACGPLDGDPPGEADLSRALLHGPTAAVGVARALAAAGRRDVRLLVAGTHGQRVWPTDRVGCERTLTCGAVRSLARDLPWLRVRLVDLAPGDPAALADGIIRELRCDDGELEVAHREGLRLARRLKRLAPRAAARDRTVLRRDGTYLVTGGTGPVGRALVRALVEEWSARVLVVGRRPPPDAAVLLGELPRVAYRALDVCDGAALRAAVAEQCGLWARPLDGVFHLASTYAERPALEAAETLAEDVRAKVLGALAVAKLLADHEGARLVAFGSANGVLGGAGVLSYAAANSFLRGLVEDDRLLRGRKQTISWSRWADHADPAAAELAAETGFAPICDAEGLRSLRWAVEAAAEHVVVGLDASGSAVRLATLGPSTPVRSLRAVAADPGLLPGLLRYEDRFRTALKVAVEAGGSEPSTRPRRAASHLEARLAELVRERLELPSVARDDNFFALGGNSLQAAQLVADIRRALGLDVPARVVFQHPTIAALAEVLAAREPPRPSPASVPAWSGEPILSLGQEHLLRVARALPGAQFLTVSGRYVVRGPLEPERVTRALEALVRDHDVLRTTFPADTPGRIAADAEIAVPLVDLTDRAPDERWRAAAELSRDGVALPFDLENGPLFRAGLLKLGEAEHLLLVSFHHLVADAASIEPFLAGLLDTPLPVRPALQYADFARWQRQLLADGSLDRQLRYWLRRLDGLPVAAIPELAPDPAATAHASRTLPAACVAELARAAGATTYATVLALLGAALFRSSRTGDVVVGSLATMRNRPELMRTIGSFVNTVILRTELTPETTLAEAVGAARDTTVGAQANVDVPFELVVERLERALGRPRRTLFDVMLLWTGPNRLPLRFGDLVVDAADLPPVHPGFPVATAGLIVEAGERAGELSLSVTFDVRRRSPASVDALLDDLVRLACEAGESADWPLGALARPRI